MRIQSPAPHGVKEKKKDWWHELTSGEILQASLHLSPARIHDAVDTTRDVGKSLGKSWTELKDKLLQVLHIPAIGNILSPEQRQHIADVALTVAAGVGYTAAGVQAFVGIAKLGSGVQEHNGLKRLEGCLDIATAGAIATTIGGMGIAPLILGPLAAALGVARGTAHAVAGRRSKDARHEVQGLLDGTRSAAVLGSLVGRYSAVMATAGAILGPVAGVIQITRGFIDLRQGLAQKSNAKEVQGLSDIGAAVGLTMCATGIGVIPGVVLTAGCVGARVLYQVSNRFAKRADKLMDRWEPGLEKAVNAVSRMTDPVVNWARPWIDKVIQAKTPAESSTPRG